MKNNKQTAAIFLLLIPLALLSSCRKEKIKPEQADSFIKYYGKGGSQQAGNVVSATDGGYVLVGTSDAYGDGKQILVIKTDAYGNEEWNRVFGGAGDDEAYHLTATDDGGYVIAGSKAESSGTNTNAWIIKLSSDGTQVWAREYGVSGKDETAARIIKTSEGGYISVGTSGNYTAAKSAVYLLKMTAAGDTSWSAKYGNGTSNDLFNYGTAIQQIDDLNYLTSAYTTDAGGTFSSLDMLVTTGRLQNGAEYKSTSSIGKGTYQTQKIDVKDAQDIILEKAAGDKYVLGTTVAGDVYILHTSKDENFMAFKSFDTPGLDLVSAFTQTSDGGFVIVGSTFNNGNRDILVIRTHANLSPVWTKTFGGNGDDTGASVIQLSDGSFVVSGTIAFGGNATGANTLMSLIHLHADGTLQ